MEPSKNSKLISADILRFNSLCEAHQLLHESMFLNLASCVKILSSPAIGFGSMLMEHLSSKA
jgi:hypothetical protein